MTGTDGLGSRMGRQRPLILLVEDQPELRKLYAEHLVQSGFDVIEAGDGAAALLRTAEDAPDVVLMDLSIPIIDGWEATRRLKQDDRTASIPLCAISARVLAHDQREAVQAAGFECYLLKPIEPRYVLREVAMRIGPAVAADLPTAG